MSKQSSVDLYKLTKKLKEIGLPKYGKIEIVFHDDKITDIIKNIHTDRKELKEI